MFISKALNAIEDKLHCLSFHFHHKFHFPPGPSGHNALLVKVVNRVLKCTKSGQKKTVVSHSKNPPSDICCMFCVVYDRYFAQKKI